MNQNDTVARIVDLLFQDLVMNDEVQAIYDETMSNCQERYADMVSRGLGEDDAIAAVIESLKGMEEVLRQYPTKGENVEDGEDDDSFTTAKESVDGEFRFSPRDISRIGMTLVSEDVFFKESPDNQVHVCFGDKEDAQKMSCTLENGVLTICRNPNAAKESRREDESNWENVFTYHNKNGGTISVDQHTQKFVETHPNGTKDFYDLESAVSHFGQQLGKLFGNLKKTTFSFSQGCDEVTIFLPSQLDVPVHVLTTNGDISFEELFVRDLSIVTTTGDIFLTPHHQTNMQRLTASSTSGDIEANLTAEEATYKTVSGDANLTGQYHTLRASTVSGDLEFTGDACHFHFSTVSGDVTARVLRQLTTVNGNSVSGDIELTIPADIGTCAVRFSTRSGDVSNECNTRGTRTLHGNISSVSGDITIS